MADIEQDLKKPVMAVHRSVKILRHLGAIGRPAGVNEIARAVEIVPSTCLHILKTLAWEGLVGVEPSTGRYGLGPTVLQLARNMAGSDDFVLRAQPVLDRISADHGVTTGAVRRHGSRVTVVARSAIANNFGIDIIVGTRFPVLTSAIGHALAAGTGEFSHAELVQGVRDLRWHQPPDADTWARDVSDVADQGYAIDRGNYIGGVTVVAAPVRAPGGPDNAPTRHAICALILNEQAKGRKLQKLIANIRDQARTL